MNYCIPVLVLIIIIYSYLKKIDIYDKKAKTNERRQYAIRLKRVIFTIRYL